MENWEMGDGRWNRSREHRWLSTSVFTLRMRSHTNKSRRKGIQGSSLGTAESTGRRITRGPNDMLGRFGSRAEEKHKYVLMMDLRRRQACQD